MQQQDKLKEIKGIDKFLEYRDLKKKQDYEKK